MKLVPHYVCREDSKYNVKGFTKLHKSFDIKAYRDLIIVVIVIYVDYQAKAESDYSCFGY
ncbi:hypothetical protein FD03_GL001225 [Companilactobacillus nodensis DSM 19682 = JCM 14932 = NBRC 107160]|uniref:Transposase n=1 Tax=Companilactobacillus nodensis DSM 19682 = JCM 14932 = NBRC 107160 TaxID=1423775 RepID=A0A0R1KBL3_9LACO|nr:hypothetical protein FD03_GL001225 [Companilactobacillus nodensis DSM 19682 = JCM 14932 = NBRC 107160]